ncbi:hypothetical protein F4782DRAFT_531907 [Xylaria castorea]|nr:hypothetical protein F4782DRAFT_531907 [Xylaria castorea]
MTTKRGPSNSRLTVSYDLGADTEVPIISRAGIALISILLAVYLLGVLSIALVAAGDRVPLLVCKDVDQVAALDEIPGSFGDATEGEGQVGELAPGAQTPLNGKRKHRSY